jgi:flavin-dependent dehydrogenase
LLSDDLMNPSDRSGPANTLADGSRIAVIGGGPAGSFFSYFFLQLAERVGLRTEVDLYERKDFGAHGPKGCNHCGGIVSESLVQLLATEGINLPPGVVQRGIESYVLHTDVGSVRIRMPSSEKRIAAMYRGAGPRVPAGADRSSWRSFDEFLQRLSEKRGVTVLAEKAVGLGRDGDRPTVTTAGGSTRRYDLVVGAVGVNSPSVAMFEEAGFGFGPPVTTKTFICEYYLGESRVRRRFGDAMHVFLLDIPRLKFAALIPKGDFVTMCLLGADIDRELVGEFVASPEVAACFPSDLDLARGASCRCFPKINVRNAIRPFTDRVVLIGDSAVTRLYKDGLGAAYYTAKASASCAVLEGVSAADFEKHYWPRCRSIVSDNALGKLVFAATRIVQRSKIAKRGLLRMVAKEQARLDADQAMSGILWDTFTGSATYRDIIGRCLNPMCLGRLVRETVAGFLFHRTDGRRRRNHGQETAG